MFIYIEVKFFSTINGTLKCKYFFFSTKRPAKPDPCFFSFIAGSQLATQLGIWQHYAWTVCERLHASAMLVLNHTLCIV